MKSATLYKITNCDNNKEKGSHYIKVENGKGEYLNYYGEKTHYSCTLNDILRWLADGELQFTDIDLKFPVKVVTYSWDEILQKRGLYQAVGGYMVGSGYDIFVPVPGKVFCYNTSCKYLSTPVSDWARATFIKKDDKSIEVNV